ncbi:MAG: nucleotide exchange factor GrpE [Desulfobacterales bacterium]|jgi:molecular chaperone GrpE|nr:nucleotide exchange factor GrpE [Desulfobacterales bacterium]
MSEPQKIKVITDEEEESGPESSGSAEPPSMANGQHEGDSAGEGQPSIGQRLKNVQAQLDSKEKEYKETFDRLLRTTAEFENYKKRTSREMDEFRKYANQSLLKEMLSVVDHIELAIQAAGAPSGADTGMLEGLNLTLKEFLRILDKFNVRPIEAIGQPFNPQMHEAIMQEANDRLPENTVVREMQKGYTINERLLRPSLVVVAAAPSSLHPNSSANAC